MYQSLPLQIQSQPVPVLFGTVPLLIDHELSPSSSYFSEEKKKRKGGNLMHLREQQTKQEKSIKHKEMR